MLSRLAITRSLYEKYVDAQYTNRILGYSQWEVSTKGLAQAKSWRQRIADAKASGHFTEEDMKLAMNWSCCAVGEKCGYQEFTKMNLSKNIKDQLDVWGLDFMYAVRINDIASAEDRYQKINGMRLPIGYTDTLADGVRETDGTDSN